MWTGPNTCKGVVCVKVWDVVGEEILGFKIFRLVKMAIGLGKLWSFWLLMYMILTIFSWSCLTLWLPSFHPQNAVLTVKPVFWLPWRWVSFKFAEKAVLYQNQRLDTKLCNISIWCMCNLSQNLDFHKIWAKPRNGTLINYRYSEPFTIIFASKFITFTN